MITHGLFSQSSFTHCQLTLFVNDPESCAAFYVRHLGFREFFRDPRTGRPTQIELRLMGEDGWSFTLGLISRESMAIRLGIPMPEGPPNGVLAMWCSDVDELWADLMAADAIAVSEPESNAGVREAWLRDPEGNLISLSSKDAAA